MTVSPSVVTREMTTYSRNDTPHVLTKDSPKKGEEYRKNSEEKEKTTLPSPKKETKMKLEKSEDAEKDKNDGKGKNGEGLTTNNGLSSFSKTGSCESEKNYSLHAFNNPEVSNSKEDETSQKGPSNITGWMESLMFSK